MRIYAAASTMLVSLIDAEYPWLLVSYALDPQLKLLDTIGYTPESLIIDSGAYTAWKTGNPIRNQDYIEWALEVQGRLPCRFFNLDVIGGEPGRPTTPAERERSMRESCENADAARERGLPVIEVFHVFEPQEYLELLLERVDDGIALAPRTDRHRFHRTAWMRWAWRLILDSGPVPRVHGLGVSAESELWPYPWDSTDSTSYLVPFSRGRTLRRDGRQDWIAEGYNDLAAEKRKRYAHLESLKILKRWVRISGEMTRMWERRLDARRVV